MRSAKETGCFPYRMRTVCYFEVFNDGNLAQLTDEYSRIEAYFRATKGETKICAVWPGPWRSDLFIIDDLEAFADEQNLLDSYEKSLKRRVYS